MSIIWLNLIFLWNFYALGSDLPIKPDVRSEHNTGNILANRGSFIPPVQYWDKKELNQALINELTQENDELKKIKYYLLNGETRLAKLYIQKLTHSPSKLRPVIHRYLGTIAFIEGEFAQSLNYLNIPELNNPTHYKKICTLKVINKLALNIKKNLDRDWERCKEEGIKKVDNIDLVWLDTLISLKIDPKESTISAPFKKLKLQPLSNRELTHFLKLALYLNQEGLVVNELKDLSLEQLEDTDVRELVGQIYFRSGQLANAYAFIEDLNSPNAENIKGNLYVLRGKYELAYAQFKAALLIKQNSQNALERLVPLAWLLADWSEGVIYAERIVSYPQTYIHKLTLVSAFHAQKGDFPKASATLDFINGRSNYGNALEVTQLASFVALMQNDDNSAKKYAEKSCEQYDFVNCWLMFQINQWDSFPLTMRRNEEINEPRLWEKLSLPQERKPLKEIVFVNQIDIEELDDINIQLIPKNNPQ